MHRKVIGVYILASLSRRLYVGVSGDLLGRLWRHKTGAIRGFAVRYRITRLVWYQTTTNITAAIEREKQIKGWSRQKKVRLIETTNADWSDLAEGWFVLGPK
jgi:putative endonuclease